MMKAILKLFDGITDRNLTVRKITVCANKVLPADKLDDSYRQLDLFSDPEEIEKNEKESKAQFEKDARAREAVLKIRSRFGKNAVIRGTSMQEGATARERNRQIGGHKS